jgi:hypothetical protein
MRLIDMPNLVMGAFVKIHKTLKRRIRFVIVHPNNDRPAI